MYDTLFLVLTMLESLISRISRIFSLIFINYFPDTPTDESDNGSFKGLSI